MCKPSGGDSFNGDIWFNRSIEGRPSDELVGGWLVSLDIEISTWVLFSVSSIGEDVCLNRRNEEVESRIHADNIVHILYFYASLNDKRAFFQKMLQNKLILVH